jgi:hypothetical protein
MDVNITLSIWSIVFSIISILLTILGICLTVYLSVAARRTESFIENSLSKIETKADMLHKVTFRQIDRLTKSLTERNT